jgi:hypothetical protein
MIIDPPACAAAIQIISRLINSHSSYASSQLRYKSLFSGALSNVDMHECNNMDTRSGLYLGTLGI